MTTPRILNEKPVIENGSGKWSELSEEDEFLEAMVVTVPAPMIGNGYCYEAAKPIKGNHQASLIVQHHTSLIV